MNEKPIRTKAALLTFMREHPEMVLEFCSGIRGDGWWWMRVAQTPHTVRVHASAAFALRDTDKILVKVGSDWRASQYRLKPEAA